MQRIIRRTIITLFVVLVALLLILWGLTPIIANTVLEDFFTQHNARFSAESLTLNPFTTEVGAENVTVTLDNDLEFELKSLRVALALLPLFEHQIVVDQVEVRGLQLEINELKDGWRIAGVKIENTPAESAAPEETVQTNEEQSSWEILLPHILLADSKIMLTRLGGADKSISLHDEVELNEVRIANIVGEGLNWRGTGNISAVANGATLDLATSFRYSPEQIVLWLDIKLLTASLDQFSHYIPAPLNQGNLRLTMVGEVVVSQDKSGLVITTKTRQLDIDQVSLPLNDLAIESERTQVSLDSLQLQLRNDGELRLGVDGGIKSFNSQISDGKGRNLLASWSELDIQPLVMTTINDDFNVSIGTINTKMLVASQTSSDAGQLPALVSLGEMVIDKIDLTKQGVEINQINLTDLESQVFFDTNRKLSTLVNLSASPTPEDHTTEAIEPAQTTTATSEESTPSPERETATQSTAPFYVVMNQLVLAGESKVNLKDEGVQPALETTLFINSLVVESLNTKDINQAMHITMDGRTGKYSSIKTDTRFWPMAEKLSVDTRTTISELQMIPVSPYVADALGYDIESGDLDMDLVMTVDQGLLDGKTLLNLRGFDLSGTQTNDGSADTGAIPLNVAVGMLKDNKNNIELEIPMTGDVENPEFGWGSFLSIVFKKALFKATTSYVLQTFVPYANVVSIAQVAGEQMLKIRLEPLLYKPAQEALDADQTTFVEQLSLLMKDKEEEQVKACPFATIADLALSPLPESLTEEQIKQLKATAGKRAELLKDALVAKGVKSSRILLCNPVVDQDSDASPRIEFDF